MKSLVLVKWLDAMDHPEKWTDESAATEFGESECQIESVGYLVSKTAKYLTLAGDWDDVDKDYGRVTKIPAACVISITNLAQID